MMMPPACQSDTRAGSRWIKTWRFCGIGIACAAVRNFSSLKHRCLIWTEDYELRFILENELELRKSHASALMETFTAELPQLVCF